MKKLTKNITDIGKKKKKTTMLRNQLKNNDHGKYNKTESDVTNYKNNITEKTKREK